MRLILELRLSFFDLYHSESSSIEPQKTQKNAERLIGRARDRSV
jgi:hypothetical protein